MDFPAPSFKNPSSTHERLTASPNARPDDRLERYCRFVDATSGPLTALEIYENELTDAYSSQVMAKHAAKTAKKAEKAQSSAKPKASTQRIDPDRAERTGSADCRDMFEQKIQAPRGVRSMKPISADEEIALGSTSEESRGTGTGAQEKKGLGKRLGALFNKKK